jgi:hypothetical protein
MALHMLEGKVDRFGPPFLPYTRLGRAETFWTAVGIAVYGKKEILVWFLND